jgi:hypothetical protein
LKWHSKKSYGQNSAKRVVLAVLCAFFAMGSLTGCMTPDNLVEGQLVAEHFLVEDANPAFQMNSKDGHVMVSLSQENGDAVSMVLIQIPNYEEQPLRTPIRVGTGMDSDRERPWTEVSRGLKQITYRSDGARILAMEVNDFARSHSGTVELYENRDEIRGFVDVQLDEGGYLQGVFTVKVVTYMSQ